MKEIPFTITLWSIVAALAFAPAAKEPEPQPVPVVEPVMHFYTEEGWRMRQLLIYGPLSAFPSTGQRWSQQP